MDYLALKSLNMIFISIDVPVRKSTIQVAYNCAPELNSTGAGVIIIQ